MNEVVDDFKWQRSVDLVLYEFKLNKSISCWSAIWVAPFVRKPVVKFASANNLSSLYSNSDEMI